MAAKERYVYTVMLLACATITCLVTYPIRNQGNHQNMTVVNDHTVVSITSCYGNNNQLSY